MSDEKERQYGEYPLFTDPRHALVAGVIYGAAQHGDLQLSPLFHGGDYTPDFVVTIPAMHIDESSGVVMRLVPVNEARRLVVRIDDSADDATSGEPDGMQMAAGSAANAVLNVLLNEPYTLEPGSYVRALVEAAVRAHPLELRGIFARAYPALANAVDLYKNSLDGVAILRKRAGLPDQERERDAHAPEHD